MAGKTRESLFQDLHPRLYAPARSWAGCCCEKRSSVEPAICPGSHIACINADAKMDRRVHATIEIIKANGRRTLSVADLARRVNLSPWRFTHLFKAETSKSPMEYLKQIRMQQAEEMLRETSLTVKEVVYAVGLNDRSHFSRDFKLAHGLTPKEFILKHRIYCNHNCGSTSEQQVQPLNSKNCQRNALVIPPNEQ
jgi:AraC-like DNA-binding protein